MPFLFGVLKKLHDVHNLFALGRAVKTLFAYLTEGDGAGCDGKEGVVVADADVLAGHYFGPALTHDNAARLCLFTGIELGTEIFRVGIGKVFC